MRTTRDLQILCVLTTMLLPLFGCGEKLPPGMPTPVRCEIFVTQDGNPLEGAMVRLLPMDGGTWVAIGSTDASGKATVYTMDRYKGAVPGKYKVAVNKSETEEVPPAGSEAYRRIESRGGSLDSFNLVEEQYGDAQTTPLEIEVKRGMPTHMVDVGEAVRVKIDVGR